MSRPRKGRMFSVQADLPKLPVPALGQTLDKYLTAIKPITTAEEFNQTQEVRVSAMIMNWEGFDILAFPYALCTVYLYLCPTLLWQYTCIIWSFNCSHEIMGKLVLKVLSSFHLSSNGIWLTADKISLLKSVGHFIVEVKLILLIPHFITFWSVDRLVICLYSVPILSCRFLKPLFKNFNDVNGQ